MENLRLDDRELRAAIGKLQRTGANMEPVFAGIGRAFKARIQIGYRNQTDPYGNAWPALKSRRGKALRDRGNLRDAWDYTAGADQVELVNNRQVSHRGRTFSLAAIHHFGATIKPREDGPGVLLFKAGGKDVAAKQVTIPPRRQFPDEGLPDAWLADALRVIERHFRRA
jgi:phage gpG-like protein